MGSCWSSVRRPADHPWGPGRAERRYRSRQGLRKVRLLRPAPPRAARGPFPAGQLVHARLPPSAWTAPGYTDRVAERDPNVSNVSRIAVDTAFRSGDLLVTSGSVRP